MCKKYKKENIYFAWSIVSFKVFFNQHYSTAGFDILTMNDCREEK